MFADLSTELSHGARVPPLQSDALDGTFYRPQSTSKRDDFGRAALSAAAVTVALDTFSSAFAMTQGVDRQLANPPESMPASYRTAADTALEKVLRDRSILFAMQMTDSSTRENEARLMLLTARLRELDPRVTSTELDVLSRAIENLAAAGESFEEFEREFGN